MPGSRHACTGNVRTVQQRGGVVVPGPRAQGSLTLTGSFASKSAHHNNKRGAVPQGAPDHEFVRCPPFKNTTHSMLI